MEIPYIDAHLLGYTPLEISVIRVISPSFFWVHLQASKTQFTEFLKEMQSQTQQRKSELIMWPQQVQEGGICSVDVGDETWQRGIITKDLGEKGVFVFLRDWGTIVHRQKNHIYVLEDKFRELPWQAIPCGLAFTAPSNFAPYWSKRANTMMRLTCEGKGGWMRIRGVAGIRHKEAYVDLKMQMENDGDAVYIRALLKSLGYTRDVPKLKTETQPFIAGMSQNEKDRRRKKERVVLSSRVCVFIINCSVNRYQCRVHIRMTSSKANWFIHEISFAYYKLIDILVS